MSKNRNFARFVVITAVLIVLTTVTASAAIGIPGFNIFDSITAYFGGTAATTQNSAQNAEPSNVASIEPAFFVGETSFQNFGTGTGSHASQTGSTLFLPNPTGSGTSYARAGAAASTATVNLVAASNPLGTTGAYMRAVSSNTASVTKVSPMVAYTSGTEFYTSFKVLFGDSAAGNSATSGIWTYYQGTGTNFSDNVDGSSAQTFTGLRFTYNATGGVALTYNNNGTFNTTGLTASTFAQGVVYSVEIVGNNKTSGTINYTYNGAAQTVAVQKYDLFINGTLVGNDLTKGGLSASTAIDGVTFTGISSSSNLANIFLDDVAVFNAVPANITVSKVSSFPYAEGFESGAGGYSAAIAGGTTSNWVLGTPAKTQLSAAHGGTKAWVTKTSGTYDLSQNAAVTSPVFDFTGYGTPTLTFWHNFKTEADYDSGILEMSTNGGSTWTKVDANLGTGGTFNTATSTGWYNNNGSLGPLTPPKWSGGSTAYTGHSSGWIQSTTPLTGASNQSDVRLRWRFVSDTSTNDEGWAIDDIGITAAALVTNDVQGTAFISPTSGGTAQTTGFSPQASFKNNGTAAQTNVPVRYRICTDGTCTTELYNQTATIASLASGTSTTVTFPATGALTAGSRTIKAKAELVGDTVTANDEITGTVTIAAPLAGDYTVGVGQNYATLTAAVADLNARGVSAAVRFLLTDAAYSGSETFPITINAVTGASASNTVTIKPSTGVTAAISGAAASSALIRFNGASYVTIDGSNAVGGTTRDLTITNTSSTSPNVILMGSIGTTPITDNAVKNLTLINGVNTSSAVLVEDIGAAAAGYFNNITIQNNSVQKAYRGLFIDAVVTGTNGSGTLITANSMNTSGTNSIRLNPIFVRGPNGVTISNNTLGNISDANVEVPVGIILSTGTNNFSVTGNTISSIVSTETSSSSSASGILVSTGATPTASSVSNNTISTITSAGTAGSHYGIAVFSPSVTVSGNAISTMAQTGAALSWGIVLSGASNSTVSGNTVSGMTSTANVPLGINVQGASASVNVTQNTVSSLSSSSATSGIAGIYLSGSGDGVTVQRNSVNGISNSNVGTYGAKGIRVAGGNNHVIRNNFVSNVTMNMTGGDAFSTTFSVHGMMIESGTGHQVYNNSVNLSGLLTGTATTSILTSAFAITSTSSTGVDVRNNIFANNITGGTTSIAHVSAYLPSGGTSAMNLTWNNNAYYYGTDTARHGAGQAGTTAGTNFFTTFNAAATTPASNLRSYTSTLLTANTNNDNASQASTAAVPFTSSTDLHLGTPGTLRDAGVTIATVTDDYDGVTRPIGAGYEIGADEILHNNAGVQSITTANPTVTVTFVSGTTYAATVTNATTSIDVTVTAADANATVSVNGQSPQNGTSTRTVSLPIIGVNAVPFVITAQDGTPISYTLNITRAAAAPTVMSVNPSSGPTAGGTSVTVNGTDFTGATSVTFDGAACAITAITSTTITCNTPAHAAGLVSVLVTTPGGTNTANTLYRYNDPPDAVNDDVDGQVGTLSYTISPLTNDTTDVGETLSITNVGPVSGGTAVIVNSATQILFTPSAPSTPATYGFSYTISDGNGGTDLAGITVRVFDPPVMGVVSSSGVTPTTATLQGTANQGSIPSTITARFRYSTTNPGTCNDSFGTRAPASGSSTIGGGGAFSESISGLAPNTQYFYCGIASNLGGTTVTAVQTFTTSDATLAADYFRSVTTGDWGSATTWESSHDGANNWISATLAPDASANVVTIRSGHTVTVTNVVSADQIVIESGGVLNSGSSGSQLLTLADDASGDDLVIQSGGVFVFDADVNMGGSINVNPSGIIRAVSQFRLGDYVGVNSGHIVYQNASILDISIVQGTAVSVEGVTFFPFVNSATVPVLRLSNVGSELASDNFPTTVNGVVEVPTGVTVVWRTTSSQARIFRNGLRGAGNLGNSASSGGPFQITETAELGGGELLLINNATGLQITSTSATTLITDKAINGPHPVRIDGSLDLAGHGLTGSAQVVVNGIVTGNGSIGGTVFARSSGQVNVAPGAATITVPNIQFADNSSLNVSFGNHTAGKLVVNSSLTVGSANNLNIGTFEPVSLSAGETYKLVDNLGGGGITGTFANHPNGETIPNFLGTGLKAVVNYFGGDGNDLTITLVEVPPAPVISGPASGGTNPTITGTAQAGATVRLYTDAACTNAVGSPVTATGGNFSSNILVGGGATNLYATATNVLGDASLCSSPAFVYTATRPTINIDSVTQSETSGGTTTFNFQVSLSEPTADTVTFDVATADGTAQDHNPVTEDNDYVAVSDSKTISAGNQSLTIPVTVNGDSDTEPNETFFVNISNVANATAGTIQGTGTITNDDGICSPPTGLGLVSWNPGNGSNADIWGINDGTFTGSTQTFRTGKVGQAFDLNGIDQKIDLGNGSSFANLGAITVEAWISPDSSGDNGYKTIVSKWGAAPQSFGLFFKGVDASSGLVEGYVSTDTGGFIHIPTTNLIPVGTGQFTHVAMTYSASDGYRIYVNGVQRAVDSANGNVALSSLAVTIGNDAFPTGNRYFEGAIDEVHIFNRALTGTEISAIYNSSTSGLCKVPQVRSVDPATGPLTGGNTVTIVGSSLDGATEVVFGGVTMTTFTVVDSEHITLTAPAHAAGPADVSVTTPLGSDTGTGVYTYAVPVPNTTVTVSGVNMTVEDTNGANTDDNITMACSAGNILITDSAASLNESVPLSSITGTITVNTFAGNDTLTLDLSGCDFIPGGGLSFNGGDPTSGTGDKLKIVGGNQGQVTYHYTNTSDGNVQMQNFGTVTYTGLEPISNTGNASDVIFELPNTANNATLSDDGTGGNGISRLSGGTFETTDFAIPSGSITITGGTLADTINVAGVDTATPLAASLTINGGTGDDIVNFTGDLAFAGNAGLNVDLQNDNATPGTDSISFASGANISMPAASTGNVVLKASQNVVFGSASSVDIGLGAITIEANQQGTATPGSFIGVFATGASISSKGANPITIAGRGGNSGAGVRFVTNSVVLNDGTGDISITGASGGGGDDATGVAFLGSNVGTADGDVTLTGSALGTTAGNRQAGISFTDATTPSGINVGGTGNLAMTGTGAPAAGNFNYGVLVDKQSSVVVGSGTTTITGNGGNAGTGSSGTDHDGIRLVGIITSSGTVSLIGNAGTSNASGHHGIYASALELFGGSANISSGNVSLTGTGSGTGYGVFLDSLTDGGAVVDTTLAGGNVTITADTVNMIGSNQVVLTPPANTVTIVQNTSGRAIELGSADSSTILGLLDAELDKITTGTVFVGNSSSGQIATTAAITHPNNLALTTGAGITFSNAVTMAVNKNLNGVAQGTATGTITVSQPLASTGGGAVSLTTARNILVTAGVSTVDGPITLNANQSNTGTGAFFGINITGSTAMVRATGTGVVTLNGRGGNSGNSPGIGLSSMALVKGGSTSGSTTTLLTGIGGTGNNTHGIQIGTGGTVTSFGGNVSVTGTAGTGDSTGQNIGVILFPPGIVTSTINGSVTVTGTGGTGGNLNEGIRVDGALSRISAVGSGTVNVTGTAGANSSDGVDLSQSGGITTSGGAVQVTGTHGSTGGTGILMNSNGNPTISSIPDGNVTLIADRMNLAAGFVSAINNGTVNIRQKTDGQTIDLGAADSATQLGLTDAELDRVTAGTLNIGNSVTGPVNVSAGITQTKLTNVTSSVGTTVLTGGSLGIFGTVTAPTSALTANGGGTVAPGSSPGVINTSSNVSLASGSTYAVEIGGTTPGNGAGFHDQLNVTGTVALGGATLTLASSGGFTPSVGQTFVIINNDASDAVSGTFAGLTSNGAAINNFLGVSGLRANIFYNAGSNSNDVHIVTSCQVDPVVTNNNNAGAGSLRQAVADACPDSTITFNGASTINLTGGQITIDKNLTIQGLGAANTIVNNTQTVGTTSRVFVVNTGLTVALTGMTISGGNITSANDGGAIYSFGGGTFSITDSVVQSSTAAGGRGGGVFIASGSNTFTNTTFSNNSAGSGGAIYVAGGTLAISDSTINNNSATSNGGGIGADAGTIGITNSAIRNNTATNGSGGGILNSNSPGGGAAFTVTNTVIGGAAGQGNQAVIGGAVSIYGGSFVMNGGQISQNRAQGVDATFLREAYGGGFYVPGGTITLTDIDIVGNTATPFGANLARGGFMYRNGASTVNVSRSRLIGNTSATDSAAIYNSNAGTVTAENNWWGCDGFPGAVGCDNAVTAAGAIDSDPRIDLRLTAVPSTILPGGTSTLTASVTKNTDGNDVFAGVSPSVLVGKTFTFAGDSHGTVGAPLSVTIPVSGITTKTFTANSDGTACGSAAPSVQLDNGTQILTPAITVQCADLTMTKTNNVSGSVPAGSPWTWTLTIQNNGNTSAVIPAGQLLVTDNLPNGPEMTYGTPTTSGNATCAIDGSMNLTCTASVGGITIAPAGSVTVQFTATASSSGAQANPRSGGIARADSGNAVVESNEANNDAADTVTATAQPSFSISNAPPVFETNGGTTTATFTITKTGDMTQPSVVHIATQNGTATTVDDDYVTKSVDVPFTATQTTETVTVTINGDTNFEPDENFTVLLTAVTNATIVSGGSTGTGTILNDDCTPPPAGMVAWYRGDGNADDSVGTNDGIAVGGLTYTAGKVGQAFNFDGVDDYVALPGTFGGKAEATVDAWVRTTAVTPGVAGIQTILAGPTNEFMHFQMSDDNSFDIVIYTNAGTIIMPIVSQSPTGVWRHMTITSKPGEQRVYVDGVVVSTNNVTYSTINASEHLGIGAQVASGRFFNGSIDEVEIFDRALSGPEVAALAAAGGGGKCQSPIVQFKRSAEMEDESQTAEVIVRRAVSQSGTTTVTAATVPGGTATGGAACTAGVDYKTTSQMLTFGDGDPEQNLLIEICPDLLYETPETIKLELSSLSGPAVFGGSSTIFLTINDTATQFTNHGAINFTGSGPASPYGSSINVSGAPVVNGGMRVTLYDVKHSVPDNIDVLLVGPLGQKMVIMGDAGGSAGMGDPVTLTFDDSAGQVLPNGGPLATGKWEPTTWESVTASFPGPAPAFPYVIPGSAVGGPPSLASGFGPGNPNGEWRLYVRDDGGAAFTEVGLAGSIAGGWGLQFITPTAAGVSVSGRVLTADGRGIRGAVVTVTGNSLTSPVNVMTGVNGRYNVEGLTAGETYIITIRSRRFVFSTPSRVVTLNDNISDADFVASPSTNRIDP